MWQKGHWIIGSLLLKGERKFYSVSSMGSSLERYWPTAKEPFYSNFKYTSSGKKYNEEEGKHQWVLIHIYYFSAHYSWEKLYVTFFMVQINYDILITVCG